MTLSVNVSGLKKKNSKSSNKIFQHCNDFTTLTSCGNFRKCRGHGVGQHPVSFNTPDCCLGRNCAFCRQTIVKVTLKQMLDMQKSPKVKSDDLKQFLAMLWEGELVDWLSGVSLLQQRLDRDIQTFIQSHLSVTDIQCKTSVVPIYAVSMTL